MKAKAMKYSTSTGTNYEFTEKSLTYNGCLNLENLNLLLTLYSHLFPYIFLLNMRYKKIFSLATDDRLFNDMFILVFNKDNSIKVLLFYSTTPQIVRLYAMGAYKIHEVGEIVRNISLEIYSEIMSADYIINNINEIFENAVKYTFINQLDR